ncbi:hypothetical protein Ddye_011868 [Dipteronia dyeriana]|uniref:Putative plant transposon protein domain-containing protein n=1 Tax=Dipteronia dyeriana TaxID=168575 RepID=A0AAD9X3G3_9ROSI|nr:hypothetical protein Ddye_011868 [Dipteronia dyeriana]
MARTKQTAKIDSSQTETGDSSHMGRLERLGRAQDKGNGQIPPCAENHDFPARIAKFSGKKFIPERGINWTELHETPIPGMVEAQGWGTFVQRPVQYCPQIVKECYAWVIEKNYSLGSSVLVSGREVRINSGDINRHYMTELSHTIAMFKGVPQFEIFSRMNIDLANSLVAQPMEFWNSRSNPIKQKRLLMEIAFWHIFISHSLRRADIVLRWLMR